MTRLRSRILRPCERYPRRWIVPLNYEDVFGRKPTRDNLTDFVRALPFRDLVEKCSAIAALSWEHGVEEPRHQANLVHNLFVNEPTYAQKVRSLLQGEMRRLLLTRETLLAIIRIAIVEQSEGQRLSEAAWADKFIRALLAANQFIYDELMPADPTQSATDLIASELRSAIVALENPHILLGRSDAFFEWGETKRGKMHRDRLPLDDDLKRFTGLNHLEFAAGAYAILSRTASAKSFDEIMKVGMAFDAEKLLNAIRDPRCLRAWLDVSSIPCETLREEWRGESSLSYAGAGSLFRRPVVIVEGGLRIAPTPALLANAMGDGTYFTLLDSYNDEDKKKLSRYYGAFFEDYVVGILERAYTKRPGATFRREFEYKPGAKSSDAFISADGDVFFVEVVAKRMNLVKSVLRLDAEQIERDLAQGVLKKMRQLQTNVENFRSGVLFPEVERTQGQRIFPILVSPKTFPRIYVIAQVVKAAQDGEERLLVNTEPIELLDVGEVEQLESNLSAGLNLGDLLYRKNRSTPQRRVMSLNNYLIDEEPGTATHGNLAQERGNAVAEKIVAVMTSWFSPD